MRLRRLLSLAIALLAAACSSKSTNLSSSSAGACNPLAAPPTSLTNVVGAGKDAAGNVYVLDEPKAGNGYRLFVTSGSSLVRQHESGSGETATAGGTAQDSVEFTAPGADVSTAQTLFFDLANDKVTSMALGANTGSSSQKGGVPSETLTLVDASSVAGMAVVNLPRTVWAIGDVSDGSVILLTLAGDDDDGGASAAVFYGPPNDLQEATVDSLSQSDSGDLYVTFTLGSSEYDAHIATGGTETPSSPASDTIDDPVKGTLTLNERTDSSLTGLSFVCN